MQTSESNNIQTIEGNGLAVFLRKDNLLYVKDTNGKVQLLTDFINTGGGGETTFDIPFEVLNGDFVQWASSGTFIIYGASSNPAVTGSASNQNANFGSVLAIERTYRRRVIGQTIGLRDNIRNTLSFDYSFYWSSQFWLKSGTVPNGTNYTSFCGLREGLTEIGVANPSDLTNIVGVGKDDGDENYSFFHNNGSGASTKIDLGSDFDASALNGTFIDLQMYWDGTNLYYKVNELQLQTDNDWSSAITTNVPEKNIGMSNHFISTVGSSGEPDNFLAVSNLMVKFTYGVRQ